MQDFRDLKVWQKAHQLTLELYRATVQFPGDEIYGLRSQMRRACVSIPANMAEGAGRGSDSDFARFLQMAMGSASEVEYHILLARDLGFMDSSICRRLMQDTIEVKRMLTSLIQTVRSKRQRSKADADEG